ncbi:MAG: hypothetical protein EOP57_01300 [Sphingomonadales bacterium]|nr:MAG: hypothetical protein EOP57_01300 [Sphingomonadales bacterium]
MAAPSVVLAAAPAGSSGAVVPSCTIGPVFGAVAEPAGALKLVVLPSAALVEPVAFRSSARKAAMSAAQSADATPAEAKESATEASRTEIRVIPRILF